MKAQCYKFDGEGGYDPCDPKDATHLEMILPGPHGRIRLPVMIGGTRAGTRNWTWNGSLEKPTIKPSVLARSGHYDQSHKAGDSCWCTYNQEHPEKKNRFVCYICHTWINDGKVQFLGDCTHEFKNQTVDLLDWD